MAQVTRLTPASVEAGDTFSVICNGKTISVIATASTAANVVGLLVAAINASTIEEFSEFTASDDGSSVKLTANVAGVPFTVTTSASNGSILGVSVATVTGGVAGVNFSQAFAIPVSAAGTFTIVIGDQITGSIAVGASAATVQTAVQGLSTIGVGNATVAKVTNSNDDVYTITFNGALAATNVATAIVSLVSTKPLIRTVQEGSTTGTVLNEIQTIDCGPFPTGQNFTITIAGQTTTAFTAYETAANVVTALQALSNVDSVTVSKSGYVFTVEFTGTDGSANQSQMVASVYAASNTSTHTLPVTLTAWLSAVNEVQTVTLTGSPTGGTFTLSFEAQTTSAIAWNAAAATVQTALQALSTIGAGNATVSGSAGGPWTVTFTGAEAGQNQLELIGNGASLTGGSAQTFTVSTLPASSGPNHWDTAANWSPVGVPVTGDDVRFEDLGADCLYGLDQTGVTLLKLTVSMGWENRKLGLPHKNTAGYREYREQQLTCGITTVVIGTGEGSGPSRVFLDTGAVQTSLQVRDTGSSSDALPAVVWVGSQASNTVEIWAGDVGLAPFAELSAVVDVLTMYGGTLQAYNTAFNTSFRAYGSAVRCFGCTLGTKSLEI